MTEPTAPKVTVSRDARAEGLVATIVIDNAARLNALGSPLLEAFAAAVAALGRESDLRVLIVTGAGERAFVGGADIRELATLAEPDAARAFIQRVQGACQAVRDIGVPVIARIQGFAFGAGLELAAACDIRVAADTAQFGMPEVRLGVPSVVEAALLPLLIGWGRARRLLLTGETIDADRALAWGLVDEIALPGALDASVDKVVGALLAGGPEALRRQKALIRRWEELPLKEAIAAGVTAFADTFETDEPQRMLAAFLAAQAARRKRPPPP
jgi:enoyl-CoA hydratase/carnithine racemase